MALKKAYTSSDGVEHPDCYWKVVDTNFNHLNKSGRITILAWHSKVERDGDKGTVLGGQKAITVDPKMYEAHFSAKKLDVVGSNLVKQAYVLIKTEDAILLQSADTGPDGQGSEAVYENYFVSALLI